MQKYVQGVMMENEETIDGTEVIENTFVKREFKTNAQNNIGCHLEVGNYAADSGRDLSRRASKILAGRIARW